MKVILQFPYAIKRDRQQELFEKYKKQWDEGILTLDGTVLVTIVKDEDVLTLKFNNEPKEDNSNG